MKYINTLHTKIIQKRDSLTNFVYAKFYCRPTKRAFLQAGPAPVCKVYLQIRRGQMVEAQCGLRCRFLSGRKTYRPSPNRVAFIRNRSEQGVSPQVASLSLPTVSRQHLFEFSCFAVACARFPTRPGAETKTSHAGSPGGLLCAGPAISQPHFARYLTNASRCAFVAGKRKAVVLP